MKNCAIFKLINIVFLLGIPLAVLNSCGGNDTDDNQPPGSAIENPHGNPNTTGSVQENPSTQETCTQKSVEELEKHCPHTPEWLKSAQAIEERVSVTSAGHVIWHTGIWSGTWKNGTWQDGAWRNGTWENGVWHSGTWSRGYWKQGAWHNGTWKNGIWYNGTWHNGIWEGGSFQRGAWKNGTWKKGTWYSGAWENGIWESGRWKGGTWKGTAKGPNFNPAKP